MRQEGLPASEVEAALARARGEDFSLAEGTILGSMCTAPHAVARAAHDAFLETNLGDPAHFPGTARLEREVLADMAALLHAPPGSEGRYLTGGTEANLLALHLAREATGKRQVVLPDSGHFSFEKAARLLEMELVWVPTLPSGHADVDAMAAAVSDETAVMVAVAGTTELGLIDDVPALSKVASRAGVRLHVDAAFGGYILPFLEAAGRPPAPFDFALHGVTTLALDPHKMGMSTIPGGALFAREAADWQALAVETPYVSTQTQASLMGTRPGAAVAACWAVHQHLGRQGFASNAARVLGDAAWLADQLTLRGLELVAKPELNVVTFRAPKHAGSAEDLAAGLEKSGFRVNVVPRFDAIRIVVMPHVQRPSLEALLAALDKILVAA